MHASYPMRDDALLGCYWELSKVTGSATGAASTNRLSIHPNETIATHSFTPEALFAPMAHLT